MALNTFPMRTIMVYNFLGHCHEAINITQYFYLSQTVI